MVYIYQERPWSRKIIEKICRRRGITVLELAKSGQFLGRNVKRQLFRMLYEEGHNYYYLKNLIFKKQVVNDIEIDKKGGKN